jgi:hypothetical protein
MKGLVKATLASAIIASALVACNRGNPNRPSVSFVSPAASGPAVGATVKANEPVTLTITNAVRTSGQTATYSFEVARDTGFTSIAARQDDVTEGPGGSTSVQFSGLAPDTTYYWHARARIDGADGEYSPAASFRVLVPVVFQPPAVVSPGANGDAYGPRPQFTVNNASYTGPAGTIVYEFQIASNANFSTIVDQGTAAQGGNGQTSYTASVDLPEGPLFWRARATDTTNGINGPYTDTVPFTRREGVDLSKVVYLKGPDVSNWPQTSTITNAYKSADQLCIFHTKLGVWPAGPFFDDPGPILEGNQWVLANINGQWYAGAADWYRPGQACKTVDSNIGQDSFEKEPLHSWHPRPGETIGVMSTTPARLWPDMRTVDERTNVVFIQWQ